MCVALSEMAERLSTAGKENHSPYIWTHSVMATGELYILQGGLGSKNGVSEDKVGAGGLL